MEKLGSLLELLKKIEKTTPLGDPDPNQIVENMLLGAQQLLEAIEEK